MRTVTHNAGYIKEYNRKQVLGAPAEREPVPGRTGAPDRPDTGRRFRSSPKNYWRTDWWRNGPRGASLPPKGAVPRLSY